MIEIRIDSNAQEIIASLREFQVSGMLNAIRKSMDNQHETMKGFIIASRMTASPIKGTSKQPSSNVVNHLLGRRTGHGGDTLRRRVATIEGDTITGGIGTNVRYIKAHEVGFAGSVLVRGHTRRIKGQLRFSALAGRKRRLAKRQSAVGSFNRNVNIPARHMIEWGVKDYAPTFSRNLSDAIRVAFVKGMTS